MRFKGSVNCNIFVVLSIPVIHHAVYMRTRSVVHLQFPSCCRTSMFFGQQVWWGHCVLACFYSQGMCTSSEFAYWYSEVRWQG